MKNLFKYLSITLVIVSLAIGCTTSQQTTEFKTIGAAESAVSGAYSAYLDLVVTGKLATNSVPQVSKAFNAFQASANTAVIVHNLSLTNFPPSDLAALAANVLTLIKVSEGK